MYADFTVMTGYLKLNVREIGSVSFVCASVLTGLGRFTISQQARSRIIVNITYQQNHKYEGLVNCCAFVKCYPTLPLSYSSEDIS